MTLINDKFERKRVVKLSCPTSDMTDYMPERTFFFEKVLIDILVQKLDHVRYLCLKKTSRRILDSSFKRYDYDILP